MKENKLFKFFSFLLLGVTFVSSLTACKPEKVELSDTPLENMEVVADFKEGKQKSFFTSDGWTNGDPFNVYWSSENVSYEQDGAKLFITEADDKFYAGELRSSAHYWYGDYEITMKPDPKKGTCSSFFIYTGPSETDEEGNPNPHDEIDIEFLGKDTTHVQFNFFVDGKGGNEYKYDLGFDASEEFHTYGFRWTESYITWYVDGKPVYRVDETESKPLPKTPGRMMMNYWCGTKTAEAWMSKYDHPEANDGSYYQLVKSSATPIVGESVSDDIDWVSISPLSDLFVEHDDKHVVTASGSSYNVVYTENVGATYTNVKFNLEDKASNMNYLYLKATNNGTSSTAIRVDVFGDATRKTVNNKNVCNISATMDGVEVPTDLSWGGSTFSGIQAGDTVEIVVYYEGIADSIQIMFETHVYGDTQTHSGNVTISDIKFAKFGDLKLPEGGNEETNEPSIKINGVDKTWAGNLETYSLSSENNSLTINYSSVAGNSYHNINTQVNDIAGNKNVVTLKIKNNSSSLARVRVDVDSNTKVNETTACNISATMNGSEVFTDTTWGGTVFEVPAGATVECVVNFDNTRGVRQLMFYIDSAKYDDSETHSGSIVISDVNFDVVGEIIDEPKNSININGVDKEFVGNLEAYSLTYNQNALTVNYNGVTGNSYLNINTQVNDIAGQLSSVKFVVTNNGTELVRLRVDIDSSNKVNETTACNVSATMNGSEVFTDTTWGGTTFEIAAGATVECVVNYDNSRGVTMLMFYLDSSKYDDSEIHSGNITISDITFEGEAKEPELGNSVAVEFSTSGAYQVSNDSANKSTTVTYEGVMDSSYQCISAGGLENVVLDNNKVLITVTNNGSEEVNLRFDVGYTEGGTLISTITNALNASYNAGEKNASVGIAAGSSVTVTLEFSTETQVNGINIFIDSAVWKNEGERVSHSGNVTISEIIFTK